MQRMQETLSQIQLMSVSFHIMIAHNFDIYVIHYSFRFTPFMTRHSVEESNMTIAIFTDVIINKLRSVTYESANNIKNETKK